MGNVKKTAKQTKQRLDRLDSLKQSLNLNDLDFDKVRSALGFSKVDLGDLHKREDEAAAKGFIGGFLLGLIVGSILALIFAPKRGDETRDMMKSMATDLVHQALPGDDQHDEAAIEREIGDAVDQSKSQFESVTEDLNE